MIDPLGSVVSLVVEQAAPAEARVASEAAVERDELGPLLERERGEVGVGQEVAAQL
jgi:hypothetical protein